MDNNNKTGSYRILIHRATKVRTSVFKSRIKLVIPVLIIYVILNILGAGCPIRFITGLSCPGCGMTRAITAALSLDFKAAFYYHPLFPLVPVIVILYLFEEYINPRYIKPVWILIITAFIVAYLVRLFFTKSDIVSIDLSSNIVVKFTQMVMALGITGVFIS